MKSHLALALVLAALPLALQLGTSTAHAHDKGGMSGGGGNVIAARPPDRYQDPQTIDSLIKQSRDHLRGYLETKEALFQTSRMSAAERALFAPLFSPENHVDTVINNVKLHIKDESPCYDMNRVPVDGSFVIGNKSRVCISSYNLAQKVHADDILMQASALLLHEYSEYMGATEVQAVEIQKQVLYDLSRMYVEMTKEGK